MGMELNKNNPIVFVLIRMGALFVAPCSCYSLVPVKGCFGYGPGYLLVTGFGCEPLEVSLMWFECHCSSCARCLCLISIC